MSEAFEQAVVAAWTEMQAQLEGRGSDLTGVSPDSEGLPFDVVIPHDGFNLRLVVRAALDVYAAAQSK